VAGLSASLDNVGSAVVMAISELSLELLALRFSNVASGGADSGPHRKKEKRNSCELSKATNYDGRSQPQSRGVPPRQLAHDTSARPDREKPVSSSGQSRVIPLLTAFSARKEPERHTQDHHHHEAHQDRVGVRTYLVQTWGPQEYLASNQYPGSDRESEDQKRDGGLDVAADE